MKYSGLRLKNRGLVRVDGGASPPMQTLAAFYLKKFDFVRSLQKKKNQLLVRVDGGASPPMQTLAVFFFTETNKQHEVTQIPAFPGITLTLRDTTACERGSRDTDH